MGKGDSRTKRGKRNRGSFGKNRRKGKNKNFKKSQPKKKQKKALIPREETLGNVSVKKVEWKQV